MIGVGVIGCGLIGTKRVAAMGEVGQLVACTDLDISRAQRLAAEQTLVVSNWQELLALQAVEAVVIATQHDSLVEITKAAIAAGKHVFVEKPAARSPQELLPVLELSRRSSTIVRVGFNHRYHRALQKAMTQVDAEKLPLALIAATDRVREALLGAMSNRAAEGVIEEMDNLGKVKLAEINSAQEAVVALESDEQLVARHTARHNLCEDVHLRPRMEGRLPSDQLVHQHAERPQVGGGGVRPRAVRVGEGARCVRAGSALYELGRQVARDGEHEERLADLLEQLGEHELDLAAHRDHREHLGDGDVREHVLGLVRDRRVHAQRVARARCHR